MTNQIFLMVAGRTDDTVKNNPPLSEEGIRQIKNRRLFNSYDFDYVFTSKELKDYASALLLVGDKVLIDRRDELAKNKKSTSSVERLINRYNNSKILLVADKTLLDEIAKKYNATWI